MRPGVAEGARWPSARTTPGTSGRKTKKLDVEQKPAFEKKKAEQLKHIY